LQRATIQMLPGRLQPLDPRVLQQEIRFIRLAGKTQSFTIGWNIGEPPAHITLNHASVRPLHAKMTYREGGWWIECLALLDPLLVNESELSLSDSPRALSDGDRITIGSVAFRFCLP
jgi:predicted component of type VI protein secretion system